MANGAGSYVGGATTGGFWTGLISGLGDLLRSPIYAAQPTQPNPQSQVLVARNSGFVVDPGAPATPYNPKGYSQADMWYDPINPTYASNVTTQTVWDNQRGKYVQVVTAPQQRAPHIYYVKSANQAYNIQTPPPEQQLFRAPDAAVIQTGPCDPVTEPVAAASMERINRLTLNQFFSPFRARRYGGNSYQALSEPADDIFSPDGKAGNFDQAPYPDFIQSRQPLRTLQGRTGSFPADVAAIQPGKSIQ